MNATATKTRTDSELLAALRTIVALRPMGKTPKFVPGELIEQIEMIALNAIADAEGR